MKVSLQWLKEFVPLESSAEETAAVLSRLGFEIASIENYGGKLKGVVVAEVRDVQKHPNADRLSVCQVFDGQNTFSVVCGAPNVRAGIRVPFARLGATLPDGTAIRAAKLRGVDSQGMICSAEELAIAGPSDGIMILPDETPLGGDVRALLGLDDAVIEIEITPNRRDALSILGVARELAAGLGLPLKMPEPRVRELDLPPTVSVVNDAIDLCPRYIARTIREVKVAPSPEWMVRRLMRCGLRAINNIVDITNYVMLEFGQPMHAFDVHKLNGRQLRIRRAQAGEMLLALDGTTVMLQETMLVIADEKRPVALAGIIGGQDSSISNDTVEIVLESAAFAAEPLRLTRKAVGISTESSFRFERGTDWEMVALAARRAVQLVQELAGGVGCKPIERASAAPVKPIVKLRTERMREFLGVDIKEAYAADILRRLGGVINMGTGQLSVTVPSWRLDITTEADLMEEIARLYGYDNIPDRIPAIRPTTVPDDVLLPFERRLAQLLMGLGFSETFNYSFLNDKYARPFEPGFGQGPDAALIRIANPRSTEQAVLRPSLLPSLLLTAAANFRQKASGVAFYELSRVFHQDKSGRHESRRLAILMAGDATPAHWRSKSRKADFYDLKGCIESLLQALHIGKVEFTLFPLGPFHPQKSCVIMEGTKVLGWAGEVHPDLLESFDLTERVLAAELHVPALYASVPQLLTFLPLSAFPSVRRDLSFVIPETTSYDRIVKALRSAAGPILERVSPIDLFSGEKIAAGKKSMTVSVIFRHRERTLNDSEIETVTEKMIHDLERKCEAVIRR